MLERDPNLRVVPLSMEIDPRRGLRVQPIDREFIPRTEPRLAQVDRQRHRLLELNPMRLQLEQHAVRLDWVQDDRDLRVYLER